MRLVELLVASLLISGLVFFFLPDIKIKPNLHYKAFNSEIFQHRTLTVLLKHKHAILSQKMKEGKYEHLTSYPITEQRLKISFESSHVL